MAVNVSEKLCWRLKELPAATGLTIAFWRKVVLERKIEVLEIEGGIAIADAALREFLTRKTRKALNQAATVEVDAGSALSEINP